MNALLHLDRATASAGAAHDLTELDYHLNVALVYQDLATRRWAEKVRDLMAENTETGMVHSTQWFISDLVEPGIFTRGIQALANADAIVIAVHGADRFPGAFYMWVNLWLQVRSGKPGALVALVGTSNKHSSGFMETRRYLHAVASQGHLDLFFSECDPSEGSVGIPEQELLHWAQAA